MDKDGYICPNRGRKPVFWALSGNRSARRLWSCTGCRPPHVWLDPLPTASVDIWQQSRSRPEAKSTGRLSSTGPRYPFWRPTTAETGPYGWGPSGPAVFFHGREQGPPVLSRAAPAPRLLQPSCQACRKTRVPNDKMYRKFLMQYVRPHRGISPGGLSPPSHCLFGKGGRKTFIKIVFAQ